MGAITAARTVAGEDRRAYRDDADRRIHAFVAVVGPVHPPGSAAASVRQRRAQPPPCTRSRPQDDAAASPTRAAPPPRLRRVTRCRCCNDGSGGLSPVNTVVNAAHVITADYSTGSSRSPHAWRNRGHRAASRETSHVRGRAAAGGSGSLVSRASDLAPSGWTPEKTERLRPLPRAGE